MSNLLPPVPPPCALVMRVFPLWVCGPRSPPPPPRHLVLVIRRSRLLRSSLRDIDYYGVWSFRGVSHVVVLFRSGTLRHKAFGGLSEMGYWAERSSSGRGVVYFQTPL